jgi:hypothetical protein
VVDAAENEVMVAGGVGVVVVVVDVVDVDVVDVVDVVLGAVVVVVVVTTVVVELVDVLLVVSVETGGTVVVTEGVVEVVVDTGVDIGASVDIEGVVTVTTELSEGVVVVVGMKTVQSCFTAPEAHFFVALTTVRVFELVHTVRLPEIGVGETSFVPLRQRLFFEIMICLFDVLSHTFAAVTALLGTYFLLPGAHRFFTAAVMTPVFTF